MLKKTFLGVLFAALVLCPLIAGINFHVTKAEDYGSSGTSVGGIIWENTTWTLENSPYIITDTVQIPENVTLTIEPGVTVTRPTAGDMFLLQGRIEAIGTISNEIVFDGGGNSNFFYAYGSAKKPAHVILSYCKIRNGRSLLPSNGYDRLNLTYCEIIDVYEPCSPHAPVFIKYNIFINWCSFVVGASGGADKIYIINNLFIGRSSFSDEYYAVKCIGYGIVVKYNTFLKNNQVLQVYPDATAVEIDATENYWGTNDTDVIDSIIYDKKDDIRCAGFIEYLPILTEPYPDTPALPLIVNFTYSPSILYANVTATFDASASFGLYSSIANYTWNFGDGTIVTLNMPIMTYGFTTPNEYNVTLTVTDEFRFKNSTSTTLTVHEDNMPPVTIDDYDGLWRNTDFVITLTVTDNESGVDETYYRINEGPVKSINIDGQPRITTEGANNTLEYWSVDNAGNEELPHKILTGIILDTADPMIKTPSHIPEGDIQPNQQVTVSVNVTDSISRVKNVTLSYNLNDSAIWTDLPMTPNPTTGLYEAIIPGQHAGTFVKYRITAYDNAGNYKVEDNSEHYYTYTVIPEFSSLTIILLSAVISTLLIVLLKKMLRNK